MPKDGFQVHGNKNISLHLWTKQKIRQNMYYNKFVLEFHLEINCFSIKILRIFSDFLAFIGKKLGVLGIFPKKFCCFGPN